MNVIVNLKSLLKATTELADSGKWMVRFELSCRHWMIWWPRAEQNFAISRVFGDLSWPSHFSHLRCCIQVGINHIQMPPFSCLTHKWDSLSSIYLEDTNHCHCILSQHLQFTIIHSAFQNFDYGYLSGLVIVDSTSETKMFPPIWKPTNKMRNKRHTSIKSVFDQFQ